MTRKAEGKEYKLLDQYVVLKDDGLYWRVNRGKRKAGDKINGTATGKYLYFGCGNTKFYVHRAIYYLKYGRIPDQIDHIDGNPSNNAISNLQDVTKQVNMHRRHLLRENKTSKYKGVMWDKRYKKWLPKITHNFHTFRGGSYQNEKIAAMAYDLLAIDKLGAFALTNFDRGNYDRNLQD